jgi:hypothetical protein
MCRNIAALVPQSCMSCCNIAALVPQPRSPYAAELHALQQLLQQLTPFFVAAIFLSKEAGLAKKVVPRGLQSCWELFQLH